MTRDDGEGFDPHPGDPWHPSWSGGGDEEDELDEAPQPREGEDRAGFLKRLLGKREEGEEEGEDEDADSAAHVYDPIREEEAPPGDETDAGDEAADTEEFAVLAAEADEAATEELVPAETSPVAEPAPELLSDVSFDAQSAGVAGAEWALDREPDGHLSDAAARVEAELGADAASEERDALDAELRYAAATATEANAAHAGETAAAGAAMAADQAAVEEAAAAAEEASAARSGRDDVESDVAAEDGRAAEAAITGSELAAVARVAEDEESHVAAQLVDAASVEADEVGRHTEDGVADAQRAVQASLLGDEVDRWRLEAAEAEIDDSDAAARRNELSLEAVAATGERELVEAELAAAAGAVAAEREREAYLLGTDDAATSFAVPEMEVHGFQFEAAEPEEPEGTEEPASSGASDQDDHAGPANAAAAAAGVAAVSAGETAPWRRGWRRLFGAKKAAEVAAGEPADSADQGVASEVMAGDTHAPDDEDEEELHLVDEAGNDSTDDPHLVPAGPDAGFEGWLGGSSPVAGDEDEHESEIAGWMAFAAGSAGASGPGDPTDEIAATGEMAASGPAEADEGDDEEEEEEDTTEFLLDEEPDEDHVGETEAAEAVVEATESESGDEAEDDVEPIGTVHELSELQEELPPGDEIDELGYDAFEDYSQEDYLAQDSTTRDHAGLAAAMAMAEEEGTQPVALSAPIPGIETGVVGFEDVVAAEGQFAGSAASPRASDLALRVGSAVLLIIVFLASLLWQPALIGLAVVVFVIAAGEFYTVLMQKGYRPLAFFGFLALVGASLGTVAWGVIAIPMAFALTSLLILLYFAVAPGRDKPLMNYSVTIAVAAWVGLGAFAFPIIEAEDYRTLVLAAVAAVAIMDITSYFVGRLLGRNQLAPVVSPKKTWEGLVGGVVVVLIIGALLHYFPPFDLTSGLVFGVVVAVVAPLGDLAVSVTKRSIGVKDMGSILPGHGGLVDRIDSLLFVIPAAWAVFTWLDLL